VCFAKIKERGDVPFGSVDRPIGFTSTFIWGSIERLTSLRSDSPCKLATVRSSGIRILISESRSAYSFSCSLRFRQTISSASCIYIVAELLLFPESINRPHLKMPAARVGKQNRKKTYTEMVVYKCAASAVSWILIRKKICGPDELYELGKTALLSVEGGRALELLLLGGFMEEGANVPLDESTFLVLATREGLRCIFPSRILFCCTSGGRPIIINCHRVSN
jgi:hypothetical protein